MRNIFLENSYTNCGGETNPRPFSQKSKWSISMDQWSKVLFSLFGSPAHPFLIASIIPDAIHPLIMIFLL